VDLEKSCVKITNSPGRSIKNAGTQEVSGAKVYVDIFTGSPNFYENFRQTICHSGVSPKY